MDVRNLQQALVFQDVGRFPRFGEWHEIPVDGRFYRFNMY
jgi:hypothetical protein